MVVLGVFSGFGVGGNLAKGYCPGGGGGSYPGVILGVIVLIPPPPMMLANM